MDIKFYPFQEEILKKTKGLKKVAYYLDMGLGKTFIGSEHAIELGAPILCVCQKSKVEDWVNHFNGYYTWPIYDLTKRNSYDYFINNHRHFEKGLWVAVINYDILYRREEILKLENFTLILDESSLMQHYNTKRTKAVFKLKFKNIVLLSGTPCSGKYENLVTQCWLLGWRISKKEFWSRYVVSKIWTGAPIPIEIVIGYKNVEDLKENLRDYNATFLLTKDCFSLPEQTFTDIKIENNAEYKRAFKDKVIKGEPAKSTLALFTGLRQLTNSSDKIQAYKDLLESTSDRLIVFYNFDEELNKLRANTGDRPISIINGKIKDLSDYEKFDNSVTFIQYQAGAMGLNLQKANKIIYYAPPLSSELYQQSQKRIHRIGQAQPCFYYRFITKKSIEEKIYLSLEKHEDYTVRLFEDIIK